MTRHQELRILQYNVQKSRDVVLASLFKDRRILEYDILAIQELWRNPFINTSYYPLKRHFHLTYLEDSSTRVCLYINKRLDPSTWSVTYTTKDIISLKIRNPNSRTTVHLYNIYNKVGTDTLSALAEAMDNESPHDFLILGDFNLHHPLWSPQRLRARESSRADQLLTLVEDFQLQLITVPRTATHR